MLKLNETETKFMVFSMKAIIDQHLPDILEQ